MRECCRGSLERASKGSLGREGHGERGVLPAAPGSRCPGSPERGSQPPGEPRVPPSLRARGSAASSPRGLPLSSGRPFPFSPRLCPGRAFALSPPGVQTPPAAPSAHGRGRHACSKPRQGYPEIGSLSASRRLARIDVLIAPRAGFGAKGIKIKPSVAKR